MGDIIKGRINLSYRKINGKINGKIKGELLQNLNIKLRKLGLRQKPSQTV